jgi:hypothetical protein
VIVAGSIALLKVAVMFALTASFVIPPTGLVETTVGAVVSGAVPVVKLHILLKANALPARSVAPVVIIASYVALESRVLVGVKVAITPVYAAMHSTVAPVTSFDKVKVAVVSIAVFIFSLKVAVIILFGATPVASLVGFVEVTVGLEAPKLNPLPAPVTFPHPISEAEIKRIAMTADTGNTTLTCSKEGLLNKCIDFSLLGNRRINKRGYASIIISCLTAPVVDRYILAPIGPISDLRLKEQKRSYSLYPSEIAMAFCKVRFPFKVSTPSS